ncbi:hypothetical protein ElyMa_000211200 [Elysia marginata]|uniref:Uncharacterized protein n=1 Tax=Elysia marginata TaxID=1093978 RepID=A0AAV4EXM8_9GAST|nr:hypothetical protein ElyMa_000211200 [Elysia marginata]
MSKMKDGEATDPDIILVELIKALEDFGIENITGLLNEILGGPKNGPTFGAPHLYLPLSCSRDAASSLGNRVETKRCNKKRLTTTTQFTLRVAGVAFLLTLAFIRAYKVDGQSFSKSTRERLKNNGDDFVRLDRPLPTKAASEQSEEQASLQRCDKTIICL